MKLSVTPISLRKTLSEGQMDIAGFIHFCAQRRCAGIDLLSSMHYPWVWQDVASQVRQVPRWLREAGLAMAGHGCGNNFCVAEPSQRAAEVQKVKAAIREAAELGAPTLRLFGGHLEPARLEGGLGAHIGIPLVIQGIEQCLPEAERCGVVLALENHQNMPGHSFEIAGILRQFQSPHLRCTFDCANFLGNAMDEPEDPLRALDTLLPHVAHVHVKDIGPAVTFKDRRTEAYVAGQGVVPLRQLTARLIAGGYDGFFTLEFEAGFKMPELDGVTQSLAYLSNLARLHAILGGESAVGLAR
jgi:sugar phosphate isomerase/epimerase